MNILNKLTVKHLKMNKKRTIVTIVGIILSTALMVGIGAIASSFRDNGLKQLIASSGDYHARIDEFHYDQFQYIENNATVKEARLERLLGYAPLTESQNEYKPYLFVEEGNEALLKQTTLLRGRLPENEHEVLIPNHLKNNAGVDYKLGDTLTLNLGKRVLVEEGEEEELPLNDSQNIGFSEGEYLTEQETKTYQIVGFIERLTTEPHQAPGYTILTKLNTSTITDTTSVNATIVYRTVKDVHKKTIALADTVKAYTKTKDGDKSYQVSYNEGLLSFYGQSSYDNINDTLMHVVMIVLALIMAGCAIVIYNSFAISIMERKKQFGLFSSIGATKQQLKKTVFYEAFIVGLIGIPIGIISGILGIFVVLQVTNSLLPDVFSFPLTLSLYPSFIIIPIIYMILTIILSAYLPAKRASKISPIEAIRLNDDIKIKKKSVKTSSITTRLFGIEGELAQKNMKRNKKKYRITILSLVVSIVLFISFSTFLEYGKGSTSGMLEVQNYDVSLYKAAENDPEIDQVFTQLLTSDKIEDRFVFSSSYTMLKFTNNFSKELKKMYQENGGEADIIGATVYILGDKDYKDYIQKLNLGSEYLGEKLLPIILNKVTNYDYQNKKITEAKVFAKEGHTDISLLVSSFKEQTEEKTLTYPVYVTSTSPSSLLSNSAYYQPNMIISQKMYDHLGEELAPAFSVKMDQAFLVATDHRELTKELTKKVEEKFGKQSSEIMINDITEAMQYQKNLVLVVGIFLYGFITLVTLIGITSVFNTINTSIALRRKEFAVLRSIGLTPKGFNKMMAYESILYGLKALLIGLPLSIIVIFLFHLSFQNIVSFSNILIPWKAILLAIAAVFVITFVTMMYASRKIKKENILDAIREENI